LKRNDVYLTASRNEPAGMHHIEGALCGLPILYFDSGALKEYCQDFGLEFNQENFLDKLLEIYDNFEVYQEKIKKYHRTAEATSRDYYDFIKEVYAQSSGKHFGASKLKIAIFAIYNIFYRSYWQVKRAVPALKNKFLKLFS
jgi:hypothetical protein